MTVTSPDGRSGTVADAFAFAFGFGPGCGPLNYCSRTDVRTVQLPSPIPNMGSSIGESRIIPDPDFSNRILRATDADTMASASGVSCSTA